MTEWLKSVFVQILSMSVSAGWTILVIAAVRLVLHRVPKRILYPLWAAAAFRMCCPFSIHSLYSLMPSAIDPSVQLIVQPPLNGQMPTGVGAPPVGLTDVANASAGWDWTLFFAAVWAAGLCFLLLFGAIQTGRLANRLKSLEPAAGFLPAAYLPAGAHSTFLFGVIRPCVYLPKGLSEREQEYIFTHELSHLRRGDHIAKPLFWLLVCVHWMNPLAWLAFYLFEMDMEKSCDERVIQRMAGKAPSTALLTEVKKEYSSVLLKLSSKRRFSSGQLLALGENGVKGRIRGILGYKKTKLWISVIAFLIVAAVCAGLALSPGEEARGRRSLDLKVDNNTSLSIGVSLPDMLSFSAVMEGEGNMDAPQFWIMYQGDVVGSLAAYPFATDSPEDLRSVDTSSEQLPMQIYATIALSNHVDYQNGYEAVSSTGTASSAVCRPLIHDIEDYAGHTPDAPWIEYDGILAYDMAGEPYFIVFMLEADVVSHDQLIDVARSVVFFHE